MTFRTFTPMQTTTRLGTSPSMASRRTLRCRAIAGERLGTTGQTERERVVQPSNGQSKSHFHSDSGRNDKVFLDVRRCVQFGSYLLEALDAARRIFYAFCNVDNFILSGGSVLWRLASVALVRQLAV